MADYLRLDRAMAIRKAEYDYVLPSLQDEALTLGTWITASDGKPTMERRFQIVRNSDQATILRGRWDLVCIEVGNGKATAPAPEFCQVYLPALVGR